MATILFLSHTPRCSPFKVGSYHLSRELAQAGHRVVHISAPITPLHLLRWRDAGIRRRLRCWWRPEIDADGVLEVVPFALIPWGLLTFAGKPSPWYFVPFFWQLLRRYQLDSVDLVLIDEPRFVSVLRTLRARQIIYRATDLYAEMRADQRIVAVERDVCRVADSLIGTSSPVCEWLQRQASDKTVYLVENGVQIEQFLVPLPRPPEYADLRGPIAVYVGALDERFGFDVLRTAAQSLPHVQFAIVGPIPNPPPEFPANVHLLGARPYDQIAAYMMHADIGIMPLSPHPANNGRSPMKLYEYAAAGLPVAATATDELSRRALPFVHLAPPQEYSAAVQRALQHVQDGDRAAIKQFADNASWTTIARNLLRIARREPVSAAQTSALPLGAQG